MEKNGDEDRQPVLSPGTLEFVENAIQIPMSYDEELNKQRFDRLPPNTDGIQQLLMTQLGQPGTSNSTDQVSLLPVSGTQRPENQMAAGFQPLTQQQSGQPAEIIEGERKRRDRKRECDRAYRKREKEKKQKLMDENQAKDQLVKALKAEIERLKHELEREQQLMKSTQLKLTKLEAEKEYLEGENLLLNERLENKSRANLKKHGMKKPNKKLKKQVMMRETAEET